MPDVQLLIVITFVVFSALIIFYRRRKIRLIHGRGIDFTLGGVEVFFQVSDGQVDINRLLDKFYSGSYVKVGAFNSTVETIEVEFRAGKVLQKECLLLLPGETKYFYISKKGRLIVHEIKGVIAYDLENIVF